MWKLADPGASVLEWHLELVGLSDAEAAAIEALFQATEGRLASFTFLDPFDNLIAWSDDFGAATWQKGASLEVTNGIADPAGGTSATRLRNAGGSVETIEQALAVPSWYQYCVSAWVRGDAEATMSLTASSAAASGTRECRITPTWKLWEYPVSLGGAEETVRLGIALPSGCEAELYGFQVEPQRAASGYKRTTTRSGLHPDATFADDALLITAQGIDNHSCTIRIHSALD